jgi:DNA-binding GntR family transcriptional regulator
MSVPDYRRVMDHVIACIRSGKLRPGDRLESIRDLAAKLDTSRTTVKMAQAMLRSEGWIVGQQGKAVYVADHPPISREDHPA